MFSFQYSLRSLMSFCFSLQIFFAVSYWTFNPAFECITQCKFFYPFIVINPYLPSGLFHPYQLEESIFIFRGG